MSVLTPYEVNLFIGQESAEIVLIFDSGQDFPPFSASIRDEGGYKLVDIIQISFFDGGGLGNSTVKFKLVGKRAGYGTLTFDAQTDQGIVSVGDTIQANVFQSHEPLDCSDYPLTLLFMNRYGAWESLTFNKKWEFSAGQTGNERIQATNRALSTFPTELTKRILLRSGRIWQNECQYQDLYQSPFVYLLEQKKKYLEDRRKVEAWQFEQAYKGIDYVITRAYLDAEVIPYDIQDRQRTEFSVTIEVPTNQPQRI